MATERRLAGITLFSISGSYFDAVGEVAWAPGGWKREPLMSLSGPRGEYKEVPFEGMIRATLRDRGDISIADFMAMEDETVVVEAANGKSISGAAMYCTGEIEVNVDEATFTVTFQAASVGENG